MGICDKFKGLPVAGIAGEVNRMLEERGRVVVTAPPGAGKSTLLPLTILESVPEGKILMVEPRRIAARQVAERMAVMIGEKVGQTVGYRVRFDSRVSDRSRIEVLTEGILERFLVEDSTLDGVSTVIFDEFHERSIASDLSLALVREIQQLIRPDLRIVVMSATIDAEYLCRQLDAVHIACTGNIHEVNIIYCDDFETADCAVAVASAVRRARRECEGDILAFLPGQSEIMKCKEILDESREGVEILTLYGMLSPELQRKVLDPRHGDGRRVVLATPIAETSLTIEGIKVVIDSGLYRTPVYEPSTGLSRLTTVRISKDMAVQRAGRAGRLCAGTCYRLWSKATDARMADCRQPEILTADLSPTLLTACAWGESELSELPWVTPPPAGHVRSARELLLLLGAIDIEGRLTKEGKLTASLPCHPRIAKMLTSAGDLKATAADVAALLEEKDPLNDETDADITSRLALLRKYRKGKMLSRWKRIDQIAAQYCRMVNVSPITAEPFAEDIGRLIASAFPERIAMKNGEGKYRLSAGGPQVSLHPSDDLSRHEFLAVASMGARIFLAAPLAKEDVKKMGRSVENVTWDSREGRAVAREELRVGVLTIETKPMSTEKKTLITEAIANAAPKEGLTMFDFNDDVKSLQLRIGTVATWHPELELPDVSTESILATAHEWLPLYIGKASTAQDLRKINMCDVITGIIGYDQSLAVDRIAPTSIKLPSGRSAKIHYRRGAEAPVVSARLQDCFGLMKTPCVDGGKRPVLMELLSPGFKPVQLTQDMEGFWRETYFEIRKELRRRYPKHRWPENPLEAL
ncbi:MAG: ATP-dependent helicase HrpB [Duncaniella sp.]|nr:ATP-dependent helicase HrpB [Duncaniella sp.]